MHSPSTSLVAHLAIALFGATAAAQPAAGPWPPSAITPSTCSVNIVRAPDDVRAVVERWLRDEPRCVALEVRIIPTDGKLYVLARDDRGRVHERVVPDATNAAVLIVSWAADDTIVPPAPTAQDTGPVEATPAREPAAAPPARVASVGLPRDAVSRPIEPPGIARPITPHPGVVPSYPRWIGAGGLLQVAEIGANTGSEAYGGRADVDVWTLGSSGQWVVGAGAGFVRAARSGYSTDGRPVAMQAVEASAVARLGLAGRSGRWEVAPSIALGYLYTYAEVLTGQSSSPFSGFSAIGQAGLTVSFRISTQLAITTGAIATAYTQQFADPGFDLHDLTRPGDIMMLGGLRWGL